VTKHAEVEPRANRCARQPVYWTGRSSIHQKDDTARASSHERIQAGDITFGQLLRGADNNS
jgi:hypothetical protein